ncbi:hypothetical protein [Actinoallomurus iriomotensis]|uniref:Uncharacterized protein n=1 Tax=Actinoallomurus iriomotensis TaxID=478107 RepID=A0A9W6RL17_9ACTN|nr:hypothetical protein [Actinoallomurus iriomotensis]GLY77638.1 hypothetical protein Airi01_059050 [Actinoallomurus iriomotensis]
MTVMLAAAGHHPCSVSAAANAPDARHAVARRDASEAVKGTLDRMTARLPRWAIVGVRVFSLTVPAMNITAVFLSTTSRSPLVIYSIGTALYVPFFLRLVWRETQGRRPGHAWWLLVAMALIIIGLAPWAGPLWPRSFGPLALAVLIVVRRPWSPMLYGLLLVAPIPVDLLLGAPEEWIWGSLSVNAVLGPYVLLLLARSIGRLESARQLLAAQAVVRERERVDDELRDSIGAELAAIADRAQALAVTDRPVTPELDDLVAASRRTLAGARFLIRGYQQPSLRRELDTAVALLAAAGVSVGVVAPRQPLRPTADERARPAVREAVAQLLRRPGGSYVLTIDADGDVILRERGR